MKLKPLMTMHADLKPLVDVGNGPLGQRLIADVIGGNFEGGNWTARYYPAAVTGYSSMTMALHTSTSELH